MTGPSRTQALRGSQLGLRIDQLWTAALTAVDPRRNVAAALGVSPTELAICGHVVPRPPHAQIRACAIGKAALGMALGLCDVLGDDLDEGLAVVPHATSDPERLGRFTVIAAAHPVPDASSERAGRAALELAARCRSDDILIVLLSGGASALCSVPRTPLAITDLAALTQSGLASGIDIDALNSLRKRVDAIKGGGLARAATGATVLTLIISDVISGDLAMVGSGPTYPDLTSDADAREVLAGLPGSHERVHALLERPSAVAPAHPHPLVHPPFLLADNATAVTAALARAHSLGERVVHLPPLGGEARRAGVTLGGVLAELAAAGPRTIAIAGGETTVTVRGPGSGGRNQELALASVPVLMGVREAALAALATDGRDGPTDAAGAIVGGETLMRAMQVGYDPASFLAANDSYRFFDGLGDLVHTGPTGTNVGDLAILACGEVSR